MGLSTRLGAGAGGPGGHFRIDFNVQSADLGEERLKMARGLGPAYSTVARKHASSFPKCDFYK